MFKLVSKYFPAGDQPKAIKALVDGIGKGDKHQVLLGATQVRPSQLLMLYNKQTSQHWFSHTIKLWQDNCIRNSKNYFHRTE